MNDDIIQHTLTSMQVTMKAVNLDEVDLSDLLFITQPSINKMVRNNAMPRNKLQRVVFEQIMCGVLPKMQERGVKFPDVKRVNNRNIKVKDIGGKQAAIRELLLRAINGREQFDILREYLLLTAKL